MFVRVRKSRWRLKVYGIAWIKVLLVSYLAFLLCPAWAQDLVSRERQAARLRAFEDGRQLAALCRRWIADDVRYDNCWFDTVFGCPPHQSCSISRAVDARAIYQSFYDAATLSRSLTDPPVLYRLLGVCGEIKEIFGSSSPKAYCDFWELDCSLLEAALAQNSATLASIDAREQQKQQEQQKRGKPASH